MLVREVIEKEVTCCKECPFFKEMEDMGCIDPWCSKRHTYLAIHYDVEKGYTGIDKNCPFLQGDKRMDKIYNLDVSFTFDNYYLERFIEYSEHTEDTIFNFEDSFDDWLDEYFDYDMEIKTTLYSNWDELIVDVANVLKARGYTLGD